jgi:hypothetical protein
MSVAAHPQVVLPSDTSDNCKVDPKVDSDYSTIGRAGPSNVTADTALSPCYIYYRSEQMFFWLTSPPPPDYGSGRFVFTSPVFYSVSPPQDSLRSIVQSSEPGGATRFDVAVSQTGPNAVPVVFDKAGTSHDLVYAKWVMNVGGQMVELGRFKLRQSALRQFPLLFDMSGKSIRLSNTLKILDINQKPIDLDPAGRNFFANGVRYLLDKDGNAIDFETGQGKEKKVLMTRKGDLVFYEILVNDVYAYYHADSQEKVPGKPADRFPTDRKEVEDLALKYHRVFPDKDALAIALKTAWVVVSEDKKKDYRSRYLTIDDAEIPKYKPNGDGTIWQRDGVEKPVTLALVGMHVAFSTRDRPQMIWATFEHVDNTANAIYSYFGVKGRATHEDAKGVWLFSETGRNSRGNS